MPIRIQKWKRTEPKQLKRKKRCCRKEKNILKKTLHKPKLKKKSASCWQDFVHLYKHLIYMDVSVSVELTETHEKSRQVNHEISFISINIFKVWYTDWNAGKSEKSWLASHEVSFFGIKIKY